MKRSAALIATLATLAFTGCSTIRQYDLAPESDNGVPPTTTLYVIDIGTPEFPVDTGAAPVVTISPCDAGLSTCPTTVDNSTSGNAGYDLSDCRQILLEAGVCEDTGGVGN